MQLCCSNSISESPQISQFTNHNWTKRDEDIPLSTTHLQCFSSPRKAGRLATLHQLVTLHQPARTENVRCSTTYAKTFSCALAAAKPQQEIGMDRNLRGETPDPASPLPYNPCVVRLSTVGVTHGGRVKHAVTHLQCGGADRLAFLFTAPLLLAEVRMIHLIVTVAGQLRRQKN